MLLFMGGRGKTSFQQCLLHFNMINTTKDFVKVIKKGHSPVQQIVTRHHVPA